MIATGAVLEQRLEVLLGAQKLGRSLGHLVLQRVLVSDQLFRGVLLRADPGPKASVLACQCVQGECREAGHHEADQDEFIHSLIPTW
jgi:hypothetical protein